MRKKKTVRYKWVLQKHSNQQHFYFLEAVSLPFLSALHTVFVYFWRARLVHKVVCSEPGAWFFSYASSSLGRLPFRLISWVHRASSCQREDRRLSNSAFSNHLSTFLQSFLKQWLFYLTVTHPLDCLMSTLSTASSVCTGNILMSFVVGNVSQDAESMRSRHAEKSHYFNFPWFLLLQICSWWSNWI